LLSVVFLSSGPVVGLDQDSLLLFFSWSDTTFFQGDSGNVRISVESFWHNELKFNWIGIHFSWMANNSYHALDLSGNPQIISYKSIISLVTLEFRVPLNVPIGLNQYYVMIYFEENESGNNATRVWTSPVYDFQISSYYEKIYSESSHYILDSINATYYYVADVKLLQAQAKEEYDYSAFLADQGLWEEAVTHLLNSSNILAEAFRVEEKTWRDKAFELINAARHEINQLKYECLEAESLLSQAQSFLQEAQGFFNKHTINDYKDAVTLVSECYSQAELASAKEKIYQVKRQEAIENLSNVAQSLNQIVAESPVSKELLGKARELLSSSKEALQIRTIESCESSCSIADQCLSIIDQAIEEELKYHIQVQQQRLIIIASTFTIGIFGFFLVAKSKNIQIGTFISSLLILVSSNLFRNTKTKTPNNSKTISLQEAKSFSDNIQDNYKSVEQLIEQASKLCEEAPEQQFTG
jgi:hypothetical protein